MSQRNESVVLLLALLATIALVAGGLWWFTERLQSIIKPTPPTPAASTGTTAAITSNSCTLVPPYKNPFVPSSQCPAQRNQLNADAFQNGQYPITRNLFVIVKQNGQIDQQAGEAYASLLLTPQGQELIEKAGFVRIR